VRAKKKLIGRMALWAGVLLLLAAVVGFSGVVLVAAAILSPILQGFVDRIAPMTKQPAGAGLAAISGRRKLAVLLIVVGLPGIQVMEAVAHDEHWPFSFYSMYSSDQGSTMSWMRVYGVTESGDEIFLQPNEYFQPFDIARFPYAFEDVVLMRSDADRSTKAALANVLELYENNRQSGRHAGPPLKGLRLYRVEWKLNPTASNKNTPDKRVFINAYPNGL